MVDTPRPAPGEEINPGPETVPRLAATVILLRGGGDDLEVLLAQRNPQARFMGGAWVFPGGAVNADDGDGEPGRKAAAIRELGEDREKCRAYANRAYHRARERYNHKRMIDEYLQLYRGLSSASWAAA